MIGLLKKHRFFKAHELKSSYDVIIIGAGAHGLATAYYLAKNHGVKNIAILDKSYMGAGGSGRNTTIIRSNYLTPEGVAVLRGQREAVREPVARNSTSTPCSPSTGTSRSPTPTARSTP